MVSEVIETVGEVGGGKYVHTHCVQVGDDEVDRDCGEGVEGDASSVVEDSVGEASEVVEICEDELYNTEQVKEKEKRMQQLKKKGMKGLDCDTCIFILLCCKYTEGLDQTHKNQKRSNYSARGES